MRKSTQGLKFSHSRSDSSFDIAKNIFITIDEFSRRNELDSIYQHFEKRYQIPKSVVRQNVSQHLSRLYSPKKGAFDRKLSLFEIPKNLLLYGSLVLALPFVKQKKTPKRFTLLLVDVMSEVELQRLQKIINIFGHERSKFFRQIKGISFYRGLNLPDVLNAIYSEFLIGVWLTLITSIKIKINLFPLTFDVIKNNLKYRAMFNEFHADYILNMRHYETNPVRNFLFKSYGGKISCCLQKNIFQADPIFFYIDIDLFCTLSPNSHLEFLSFGGRIAKSKAVGSIFMEHHWFSKAHSVEKKYNIVILGINTSNAYDRLDCYDHFMEDYYSIFKWCKKLNLEQPFYKIALKHHGSAGFDRFETEILEDSQIIIENQHENSYEIAFSADLCVTFGSTMGWELNGHGQPTLLLDPCGRSSFYPEGKDSYVESMRVSSYEEFRTKVRQLLSGSYCFEESIGNREQWCSDSQQTSEKVVANLRELSEFCS